MSCGVSVSGTHLGGLKEYSSLTGFRKHSVGVKVLKIKTTYTHMGFLFLFLSLLTIFNGGQTAATTSFFLLLLWGRTFDRWISSSGLRVLSTVGLSLCFFWGVMIQFYLVQGIHVMLWNYLTQRSAFGPCCYSLPH